MVKKKASTKEQEQQEAEVNHSIESALNFIASGVDLENRRIEFRGEVTEGMACYVARSLMVMAEVSNDPITIFLSSPGGDAYQAFAIYDAIRTCPCDVHIHTSGLIASSGFIICLAGDVRTALPHTTFMMHSVRYSSGDDMLPVKTHKIEALEGERLNSLFVEMASKRTKRDRKWWIRTVLQNDKYFNVGEALELGILTPVPVKVKPVARVVKKVSKKKVRK